MNTLSAGPRVIVGINFIRLMIILIPVFCILSVLTAYPRAASASETLLCDICGSEITGKYYKSKDPESDKFETIICESCHQNTPRCETCGGFMKTVHKFGGKDICNKCHQYYKDSPVCDICKLNILGAYVKYSDPINGKVTYICDECKRKSPACQLCKIPCASLVEDGGRKLCAACALKAKAAPVCKICKISILSSYTHYQDKKNDAVIYVCDDCINKYHKCFVCGVPDDNLIALQGKEVCRDCFAGLKKCHGCSKYIFKLSYKYEIAEQVYCPDCQQNTDKCDVCGLPTGANPVQLTDGRKICPDCESTAVKDIQTVRELYAAVADFLVEEYRMGIGAVNEISFKEINQMKELGEKTPTADKGVIPLGIFSRCGDKFDIFVQKNLPKNLLIGVLAHEYAHSYVHGRVSDFDDTLIDEGFAEWIRHKTLTKIGDEKGAKLIEIRTDIYGEGFKKITEIEKAKGLSGVFELFNKSK